VKVGIPQPLLSYTGQLLYDLDRQFPGIRFRMVSEQDTIRPHMKLFVNRVPVRALDAALADGDEVHIFQALSGG
jgi:molybdopterin converting factor small subunit